MDINKEYIDAQDAIKRVGGNKGLYDKLLSQFVEGDYLDSLDRALSAGDMETATRGAHTIKGTCANLSLPKLRAAALEMEMKLKSGENYESSYAALKEIFGATLQQITTYIGG